MRIVVVELCYLVEFLLFASTAIHKIVHWRSFLSTIDLYVPRRLRSYRNIAAIVSLSMELAVCLLILLSVSKYIITPLIASLLLGYALVNLLHKNGAQNCDCGGFAGEYSDRYLVVIRNLALLVLAVVPIFYPKVADGKLLWSPSVLTELVYFLVAIGVLIFMNASLQTLSAVRQMRSYKLQ